MTTTESFAGRGPGRWALLRGSVFLWLANHLPLFPRRMQARRDVLLRWAGVDIQGRCIVCGPVSIGGVGAAGCIRIGAGTVVNTEVRFGGARGRIEIGQNVLVGARVSFETASHGLIYEPGRGRSATTQSIVVEDEAWIGAGAIILQGVTIGRGAVIAAGAVVKDDVPARTVAGGVPARVLRILAVDEAESHQEQGTKGSDPKAKVKHSTPETGGSERATN